MSESTLSFASSQSFRDSLLARNLSPYTVVGSYVPPVSNIAYEAQFSDSSVINSPDNLVGQSPYPNTLYPLNEYGPSGGYSLNVNYNGPLVPVKPSGEPYYPLTDSVLAANSGFYLNEDKYSPANQNSYIPDNKYIFLYSTDDLPNLNKYFGPYWDPPTFVPSFYSPYEILFSSNPQGSEGPLSQDSFISRLGAEYLKELFIERINLEIYQNTVGAVNLASLQDPFEASLLITGQQPLVYRNWRITVPESPVIAAIDFATRLAGAYWPVSPIPGDYFDENTFLGIQTQQTSLALNVLNNITGGFLGPILNITRNPSEIFLANTGNGQRSALFNNIDYNRYRPAYDRGLLGNLAQGLVNIVAGLINIDNGTLIGGYYVGGRTSEPSLVNSPPNQLPINPYGQQIASPVYGPSELSILYEGNQDVLNFGLAAKSLSDGGGISGQFVWTSPKYKKNAGYKPTPGGGSGSIDEDFNLVSSDFERGSSTSINFRDNSILDQTQRLIEAGDLVEGITRLKHVGNAINQVSKVFNDGYKEMTKGSQVLSYVDNATGAEAGIEYCRVFAKDTPYYTYNDLQKTDGITNSGRRFSYSVLDNTFNLNISPTKNPGSTNIIKDDDQGKGGYAKKYMFSIENLAWRTSSRPGYTYDDLPTCEKGPNGGRVMWFPPYDLTFSDSSNANWTPTSFLGRPEPVFTYKDTTRKGQLSWKIIVDSPSIMNLIVEKQLKGVAKERVDSIVDSFFAGCMKYDIYTLAQKFNTLPSKDLYTYQEILNNPQSSEEDLTNVLNSIGKNSETNTSGNYGDSSTTSIVNNEPAADDFVDKYENLSFYFDDNTPSVNGSVSSYDVLYNQYISKSSEYVSNAEQLFNEDDFNRNVNEFFEQVIKDNYNLINSGGSSMVQDAFSLLSTDKKTISIVLEGGEYFAVSANFNETLNQKRVDSVAEYFKNFTSGGVSLSKYIDNGSLKISFGGGSGESFTNPIAQGGVMQDTVNCTTPVEDKNGSSTNGSQIYSVSVMACRRMRISTIVVNDKPEDAGTIPDNEEQNPSQIFNPPNSNTSDQGIVPQKPQPKDNVSIERKLKEGISKQIVRNLLTECDYFEVVKENAPMVYDSIKEKIRYFNPAFHSMTPEGLNARLTFLNQCVRPGETIPVIGSDGKPKSNDAVNTSFGAPPVLILRIGDFYNSKIIPRDLSITYEAPLFDMNPEGIGLQPMIAKITLGFDMIGGHGLAKPVEQLQNALSFNYYANTEIYDERSTWTDDSWKALDKKFIDALELGEENSTVNNVTNQATNDGGNTIGEILSTNPVESGQTGDISYQKIMDEFRDNTKTYIEMVPNLLEKVMLNTNQGIVQFMNKDRLYNEGGLNISTSSQVDAPIYGAPSIIDKFTKDLFDLVKSEITDRTNPIMKELDKTNWQSNVMDSITENMILYVSDLYNDFSNVLYTTSQEMVSFQQDYSRIIRKLNLVGTLTDGKIGDKNLPISYTINGTTEVSSTTTSVNPSISSTEDEFWDDLNRASNVLIDYQTLLTDNKITEEAYDETGNFIPVYDNFIGGNSVDSPEKHFFLIIARILQDSNKKENFKNAIIKGDLVNVSDPTKLKNKFDSIVDDLAKEYVKELDKEEELYEDFKDSNDYKDFVDDLDEKMYPKGKTRKFNYTTVPGPNNATQSEDIKKLYDGQNHGENTTYLDNAKFNF